MSTLSGLGPIISQVNIGNGKADANSITTNNFMFYRPWFNDGMGSNLAALFLNLEAIFPCIVSVSRVGAYYPICHAFTDEEDGFRGGRSILDTGDIGNRKVPHLSCTVALIIQCSYSQLQEA